MKSETLDTYTFNQLAGIDQRFILHFEPLAVNEAKDNPISVYVYQNEVYISSQAGTKGEIVIYNMMGQKVVGSLLRYGLNTLIVKQSGYYIVKVKTSKQLLTQKLFIR